MDKVFDNVNTIVSQLAFWTGLVSVMLFAVSRFKITLPDSDELSPPLLPRSFTTAFRFWLAACTYVGGYSALYFGLLVIGSFPQLRSQLSTLFLDIQSSDNGAENLAVGTPAWAALIATAALPALPGASGIDQRVRAFLQDFASIPNKARMLGTEILGSLIVPEPAPVDDQSSLDEVLAAIKVHQHRFDQLLDGWKKLQQIPAPGLFRRYKKFQTANQKLIESFQHDFSAGDAGISTVAAGLYIEQKNRESLGRMARFIACAMLQSEGSELSVRERLQKLNLPVSLAGLNFQLSHIILSLFVIALMTIIGCYLSAIAFFGVEDFILKDTSVSLSELLKDGTPIFFTWTLATVCLYTLPITLAAGAAMYVLDRAAANIPTNRQDNLTAAVLTFMGSTVLALFVLLAYGVATHMFSKVQWTDLLPWVLPPACVAATFMWLSINPSNLKLDRSETGLYMAVHSSVAMTSSLIAFALWDFTGGRIDPALINHLPPGLFVYFAVIAAGCIGASIGWVLSGTNQPFRMGNPIRKV